MWRFSGFRSFNILYLVVFVTSFYLFLRINKLFTKVADTTVVHDVHGASIRIEPLKQNVTAKSPVHSLYPLFQPAEEVDFPTVDAHAPRIPHIIHQMYQDELIPDIYIEHVKSFIKNNPTWKYRFWTDKSGRQLLEKYHPYLLHVYDGFGNNVKRSDLLRYAVLYEFGGFYADLDVDNLRSLNRTTTKYACVVSVEPFEHSVLLNNMDFLMNNAIMSCRAKHPFFKQLLANLKYANQAGYPVGTTGPGYVTREFYSYNGFPHSHPGQKTDVSSNSPFFYKGELKEDDDKAVYVPNSQYFMDKLDPVHIKKMESLQNFAIPLKVYLTYLEKGRVQNFTDGIQFVKIRNIHLQCTIGTISGR